MVTGTLFLMWLGERITERGIGNGISLIIMVGIVSAFPNVILSEITMVQSGARGWLSEFILNGYNVFNYLFCSTSYPRNQKDSGAICQTRSRKKNIWRAKHTHTHESKYCRCNANYFCTINNVHT